MINIMNVHISGFEPAIYSSRNSYDSWEKSDTLELHERISKPIEWCGMDIYIDVHDPVVIGEKDYNLMYRLAKAGGPEAKYRRMIQVWMNIEASLYWWKQFDTYKVGTTANSTSTMHSITKNEFNISNFSVNDISRPMMSDTIDQLNSLRAKYLRCKGSGEDDESRKIWQAVIDMLPESYIQLRTVNLNYEVLAQIYKWRKNHKLKEWRDFCDFIEYFPESWIFTLNDE